MIQIEVSLQSVNREALNADLSAFPSYRGFSVTLSGNRVLVVVNVLDSATSEEQDAILREAAYHDPGRLTEEQRQEKIRADDLADVRAAYEPLVVIKDPTTLSDDQLREMVVWLYHEVQNLRKV